MGFLQQARQDWVCCKTPTLPAAKPARFGWSPSPNMPRALRQDHLTNASKLGRYRPAPPVHRMTQLPRNPRYRQWDAVDAGSIAGGDVLGGITAEMFERTSDGAPGRPRVQRRLTTRLLVAGAAYGISYRRLEGLARSVARMLKVDSELVPDHTTIHRHCSLANYRALTDQLRRWGRAWEQRAPRPGEQVVVAVDATGMSITRVGGWAMDKPNSTDHRRGKYDKLHTAVDSATGEILAWELTGAKGAGSGDCTVGPHLLNQLNAEGWDVRAVCGDGAYGTAAMFAASARLGAKLLTPLPKNAVYNTCAARNELLTQQSRIGRKVWKKRSGYHARSPVEAVYATTGRQGGGNRLRNRTPATKDVEMALKVALHNMTRVARLAVAG